VREVPKPTIEPHHILVRVHAVAVNPTDYKHIDMVAAPGCIAGCDYSGEVVEVGAEAPGNWTVGDRVAGCVHGGLYPDRGSFAEYLKIDGDLAYKIPEGIPDEEAASIGVSAGTAMLALNVRQGIPGPTAPLVEGRKDFEKGFPVFIYSGATTAGLMAIQFAKAAGCTVVTTASPRSFDLVKQYGADHVYDYRSKTAVEDIIKQFPNISASMDCFSEGPSTDFCARVVQKSGGKVVTLLIDAKSKVPGVEIVLIMTYTVMGKRFHWLPPIGPKWEAMPDDRKNFAELCRIMPELLKTTIKPPPIHRLEGGFDAIISGVDKLRRGEAVGGKYVITL
jgi:NADPH:quinone reductase-like Zn-dependent oxidoreductase